MLHTTARSRSTTPPTTPSRRPHPGRLAATLSGAALVLTVSVIPAGPAAANGNEVGGQGNEFHLTNSWSGGDADVRFTYGNARDQVYVGDWDGDGRDTIAVRSGQTFRVRNSNSSGGADVTFTYGRRGDVVLVGDWNGDGRDTFAIRRGNVYHIKNSLTGGDADTVVTYGRPDDQVLVGDWNGDGRDTLAVRRGAHYFLKNSISSGNSDVDFIYGRAGDTVYTGDWDGDRRDTFMVRRGKHYYMSNRLTGGDADRRVAYGRTTDTAFVGDWNKDGRDTLGIRRSATGEASSGGNPSDSGGSAGKATPPPSADGTGGTPGARNTGVPAGTKLTVHRGDIRVTKANTVIDGLDVRGFIDVRAPGVVIRNSIVRGDGDANRTSYKALVTAADDKASVTIEDTELAPSVASPYVDGIRGYNITARRVNIHNVIDQVHTYGPNVTIEDSWLHSNAHFTNDPAWNGGPSHDDSIQVRGGKNIRIRNNTISGAKGSAIQFTQSLGTVSDVRIEGNRIDGGGCSINFSEKGRGAYTDVVIRNNTFGRNTANRDCAVIAPTSTRERLAVAQNVYAPDGATVSVRRG